MFPILCVLQFWNLQPNSQLLLFPQYNDGVERGDMDLIAHFSRQDVHIRPGGTKMDFLTPRSVASGGVPDGLGGPNSADFML